MHITMENDFCQVTTRLGVVYRWMFDCYYNNSIAKTFQKRTILNLTFEDACAPEYRIYAYRRTSAHWIEGLNDHFGEKKALSQLKPKARVEAATHLYA
jgi:hypothetical protein